ncbi:MAG: hypothetical protein GF308_07495 [Candidatus Heimdallarchaeota archaeon]|nr:hypothetical protein [Candidatus Heimdallarchaeota archaeon]
MTQTTNELVNNGHKQPSSSLPTLRTRNFWMWWLLNVLTGGIAGLVYLFINLADLNRLVKYPRPEGVSSTQTNLTVGLVSLLCVPLVPLTIFYLYCLKFKVFKNYLVAQQKQQPVTDEKVKPDPSKLMGCRDYLVLNLGGGLFLTGTSFFATFAFFLPANYSNLLTILFGICFFALLILSGYLLYHQWLWQQLMNEQVLKLDPSAQKKLL